jgi:hypothetical protein
LSNPTTPTQNFNFTLSSVTSLSVTANTLAGGGVLGIGFDMNPSGAWSSSPSGVVTPQDTNFGQHGWSHADNVAAATPYTLTKTFTSNPALIAMLAYR